jgi:hypothetical protein
MKVTYRSEFRECGKRCSGCPHGPYWYAYWREGGKLKSRYIGKELPREEKKDDAPAEPAKPAPPHLWDAILSDQTANLRLAREILGIGPGATLADARRAYYRIASELHPDKQVGGDQRPFCRANAAWAYLRRMMAR